MNRSRAAEANKHTLDVCKALVARGGLVKHVVHRGNSLLYVCLPALFDLYMQRHGVFIASYTSYARTLSSELVLQDRTHTQRFPPHYHKAAAVTFMWPADRQDLPEAEELAELLHLNEQPPQEPVSGTESGKITWGRTRIQAKPRAYYEQQQQAATGAGVVDSAAGANANRRITTNGPAVSAPTAAAAAEPDAFVPGTNGAVDQRVQQQQQSSGRPGSTSSSSSLQEGRPPQEQQQGLPAATGAAAAPGTAAAGMVAAVVHQSPFIAKRDRDGSPDEQQQQQQEENEEQQPAKRLKQTPASASPGRGTNMWTSPRSSSTVVTPPRQQQQQQTPPVQQVQVQRQHTPSKQQTLGPGSHLLTQQKPKQQQQRVLHAVPSLPLPTGMKVQKLQQLQQQPAWLPYQLPPLPPQQQQQQQVRSQLQAPRRPPVKRLPPGMRVGNMSGQGRLQLLTWLLKGRPERMQQLKLQQQGAAADGEGAGEPAAKQPKTGMQSGKGQSSKMAQSQQQQQQLSVSQVQMLQASLRKRQQELAEQQQQQQRPALRNGLLAAAGFAEVKPEGDTAAAAGDAGTGEQQQQQQQHEEEEGLQHASTSQAQQEVDRLQQELQQLQAMLLNQGQEQAQPEQAEQQQQQQIEQPAVASPQELRKRKTSEDVMPPPPLQQQQQQQQRRMAFNDVPKQQQQAAGRAHKSSSGALSPSVLDYAERFEVQGLLTAMCVVSGAADVAQLVAGIDIQLRSSSSSNGYPAAEDAAAAAGVKTEEQQQEHEASENDRRVLRELRCLALAFGRQGLRVPSLQDLAEDAPRLLEGIAALDGQQLLCLSEPQLQGFLAAVSASELQRAVHQQQQQHTAARRASTTVAAGSESASLVQLQQDLAAQLVSAYKSGRGEVVVRPQTLMLMTGQRLLAAAQQAPQLSPLQQTPLAAAVAGCLAEREVQLLQSREQGAAITGLHLLNAFMLRRKFDQLDQFDRTLAGQQQLAGDRQLVLDLPAQCAVRAAASGTSSQQLHISTVPAAVFAYPLLQQQQMLTGAAEQASSAVLSSWLFVAPQLQVWHQLLSALRQLKKRQQASVQQQQQQQQQQEKQATEGPSSDGQQSLQAPQQQQQQDVRQPASLQDCRNQAEQLLQELHLQAQDLTWLQQHLNTAAAAAAATASPAGASAAVKVESTPQADASAQQRVAVLLQQKAGQAVLLKPGWLHVVVNHAANVKVCLESVGPADVAACAVAQHELQQGIQELHSIQMGPVVLTLLQQWCAYCRQQERQLQQR